MIGHRSRFRENYDFLLWRGPAVKKKSNSVVLLYFVCCFFITHAVFDKLNFIVDIAFLYLC